METIEARAARLQAALKESKPEHWQVDVADDDPDVHCGDCKHEWCSARQFEEE